jgi:hypothetical protein
MKNTFKLFVTLFLLALTLNSSYAIPPTFNMTISNVVTEPGAGGADSVVRFDVYMQWTNSAVPGVDPFEYGSNQLDITFNPLIANGGTLATSRVNTGLPPGALTGTLATPTVQVIPNPDGSGNMLFQGSSIVPNGANNFFISSVFPGTLLGRFRVRTTSHVLGTVTPNFRFQLTPPNNTFPAYMLPPLDPDDPDNQLAAGLMDTIANVYVTAENPVLPVELASFTSSVNKNTVALAWSTARETNNQGFDIERAVVGTTDFSKVGYVAGNGTVTETKNYTYSDRVSAPGHYSYRLKQIDFNGNVEYFVLNGEVEVGIPSVYAVSQNYPNPFNPSTKIDYDIPYDGKVSILLYDISGREVGKLVNEVKTAGYYTVQFNASNLSSGMYFYRITATGNSQNFVQTKKMVLIK